MSVTRSRPNPKRPTEDTASAKSPRRDYLVTIRRYPAAFARFMPFMLCLVAGTALVFAARGGQWTLFLSIGLLSMVIGVASAVGPCPVGRDFGCEATLSALTVASLLGLVLTFVLPRYPHSDAVVAVPEDEESQRGSGGGAGPTDSTPDGRTCRRRMTTLGPAIHSPTRRRPDASQTPPIRTR
ncbi:hypothetical protein OHA71_16160 [Streptomyces sp. NBC_00444]|uniref:hypothetical protein n=1 Tax=Streptomyces sp. NBC_00444 TaxID=2975744 RepID=UPI002E1E13EE